MQDIDEAVGTDNAAAPHTDADDDLEAGVVNPGADLEILVKMINILKPLSSGARRRVVDAAMVFLGDGVKPAAATPRKQEPTGTPADESEYTEAARRWMRQQNVSTEAMERVFHFTGTEFAIHEVPGKSKREQAIHAYILTGLGLYLMNNGHREFPDGMARGFCETLGILDPPNHAKYLKDKHPEFTGDKNKGYVLSNPGLKRGAELIKEVAGSNRD